MRRSSKVSEKKHKLVNVNKCNFDFTLNHILHIHNVKPQILFRIARFLLRFVLLVTQSYKFGF